MLQKRARLLTTVLRQFAAATATRQTTRHYVAWEAPAAPRTGETLRRSFDVRRVSSATPHESVQDTPSPVSHLYTVRIVTGNVRGAGTTASIRLQLVGTEGESERFVISGDSGFEQGSVQTQKLSIDADIGTLRTILVERGDSDGSVRNESWFLEKILIGDEKGEKLTFPCMQWFGLSACGTIAAPRMRYLLPQSTRLKQWMHVENNKVEIKASGMVIPHPEKVRNGARAENRKGRGLGGEDAYFLVHGKNNIFGMGVADGVYAWRMRGIDPGRFAYHLMDQSYINIKAGYDDIYRVLTTASRHLEAEGVYGSSTCCMLTINMNNGRLNCALLGDSGFIVVGRRDDRPELHLVFRTPQQEHEFGRPFQLGHHEHASYPRDAILNSFQVFPGDTIVMGTDGLFDNLFLPTVVQQVEFHRTSGRPPQALVGELIDMAHHMSIDKNVETPYSRGFTEALDLSSSGGKPDDITVAVAYIC